MNREKIREFVRDSGLDWHRHWNDDESNQLENFAELIVRECAELAREWEDDYVVEDTAPHHSDVKIKKHFGVE